MHNILPVLTVLAAHRVAVDVLCPLCKDQPKTLDHLMKGCAVVVPIWQTILMTSTVSGGGDDCIAWMCNTLSKGDAATKLRAVAIWWSIWRARNEIVWNGKPWQLSNVVNEIHRNIEAWQSVENVPLPLDSPSHA
ncbi:uncharacterized protein LOC116027095 [Ipomoea triloba]|uniref:uncharacterized protein LOC116027095 n=1 Tax=Ipomoea triloba TaxID=35885 RepID=UPI00125D9D63|nr:uncharacterized protein LOC116027095 [Ipomoea triloba]